MKFFLGCLLFFVSLQTYCQCNAIDPQKLTWKDYRGGIDPKSDQIAWTSCKILMNTTGKFGQAPILKVCVDFRSDSSWVNAPKIKALSKEVGLQLLNHERLHYYISIISAQRLKKSLSTANNINEDEINSKFLYYSNVVDSLNSRYDLETNHGLNPANQKRWEYKIMDQVRTLSGVKLDEGK
jgi:hypothetical protein